MKHQKITSISIACALSIVTSIQSLAQETRNCATMENHARLEMMYPEFKKNQAIIEDHTKTYELQNSKSLSLAVNIPVVVHVVYNNSAQNISTAQIMSQLDVLNEDFRKLNADRNLVPSVFAPLAADCNITFCLAQKDPNGNTTTGIVRKQTTITSFSADDKVKSSATGGSNAWNPAKYLNLWVCNLGGGLLGYAQFPGGPVNTDGVVVLYSAFGRVGTLSSPFNKGRTATHEVGHWLNLRHIWGDASCGNDLVNDTPTQQAANNGCPTFPRKTCNNTGDMSMNYMDYTNDACMYMFSKGQSTRMDALFTSGGARVSLLTSTACQKATTTTNTITTNTTTTTTITNPNVLTIGNGMAKSTAVPYGTYYMDERAQIIVTKAELVLAGYTSPNKYIKSLAFNTLNASTQTMNNFTIKMSHISSSVFTNSVFVNPSNQTTVYTGNFVASSNQWSTHTFSTPFVYNGTDNILINICWDNSAYTANTEVYGTSTASCMTLYSRKDVFNGGLCTTTLTAAQTSIRPNMKFSFESNTITSTTGAIATRLQNEGITIPKQLKTTFYPNPVNDKLTLYFTIFEENSSAKLDIYNLVGSKVKSIELQNTNFGENNLDINFNSDSELQNLENGIYIITLVANGEKTSNKLVLDRK